MKNYAEMSPELEKMFTAFANNANKVHLHPVLDRHRFLDFIIQSHSENSDLDVVTLQERLESQGFSEEYALELSIKYEFGKELLNKFAQAI
jgi:hypothetical protein